MPRDGYAALPSGQGATLSVREAADFTKQWIDDRFEPEQRNGRDQMRWLMGQIAGQALADTIRGGGDGHAYQDRLQQAYDVIYNTWSVVTPDKLKGWGLRDEPTEDEKAQQDAKRVLWKRRDPLRGYQEGFESPFQTEFPKDEFAHYVADYLARPWMRHPVLDWMLVDAFVTRELSVFGEEVKRQYLPGRRDLLGVFHHRYFDAKGNLAKMMKPDWAGRFRYLFWYFALAVGIPVVAIWAAFSYGWTTTGLWLAGIYAVLVVIEVATLAFNLVRRSIRAARGEPKPGSKAQTLWGEMYQVWRLLEGPVVNPTLVRTEMAKTTDKGASWDSAAWAIIDGVVARDPAVWLVTPVDR